MGENRKKKWRGWFVLKIYIVQLRVGLMLWKNIILLKVLKTKQHRVPNLYFSSFLNIL